jgi:hypothetical protein
MPAALVLCTALGIPPSLDTGESDGRQASLPFPRRGCPRRRRRSGAVARRGGVRRRSSSGQPARRSSDQSHRDVLTLGDICDCQFVEDVSGQYAAGCRHPTRAARDWGRRRSLHGCARPPRGRSPSRYGPVLIRRSSLRHPRTRAAPRVPRSCRSMNDPTSAAISDTCSSSAKWPVSNRRSSASRTSRRYALAPLSTKNRSLRPQASSSGGWRSRSQACHLG